MKKINQVGEGVIVGKSLGKEVERVKSYERKLV